MFRRVRFAWVALVVAAFGVAGASVAHAQESVIEITIGEDGPQPAAVTLARGTVVRWRNAGTAPAAVQATDGAFSFPNIPAGAAVERRFDDPGTHGYRVTQGDSTFVGQVAVDPGAGAPTPTTPAQATPTTRATAAPQESPASTAPAPTPNALAGTGIDPQVTLVVAGGLLVLLGGFVLFHAPTGRHAKPLRLPVRRSR
jgi:plastocyanin